MGSKLPKFCGSHFYEGLGSKFMFFFAKIIAVRGARLFSKYIKLAGRECFWKGPRPTCTAGLVIRADSLEEQVFLEEESQSLKVVGVIRARFFCHLAN